MRKHLSVYIGLGVLFLLIAAYFLTLGHKPAREETAAVKKGDMTREVFITGTVKTARSVSLSFDRSGSINSLPFPVGTTVVAGAVVASLRNDSEYAAVAEAKALVAIEEANLAAIRRGTREEELALKAAEKNKADVSLQNTASKTFSVLSDAYSAAEESLNRYVSPFFLNSDTATPHLTYSAGTQESYDAEQKRLVAGGSVRDLQKMAQAGSNSAIGLESALMDLRTVQDLFITLGLTLREGNSLSATTLADYRSRVTAARDALTAAIASVQNQSNALRDGSAERDRAARALDLAQAKATPETIAGAEQELAQARAKLRGAEATLEKTLLRAPFNGQISSKHVEVGETIQQGAIIMDVMGSDGFTIEADVPEADVIKITKGALAEVTLDAYGEAVSFPARATLIEPAATEIDGVPTYKTTLAFEKNDPRLRSGLTANITIKTILKTRALTVPTRAISVEDGTSYAEKKLPNGTAEKIVVTTGIRNNRDVEITAGLNEGDTVVIPIAK